MVVSNSSFSVCAHLQYSLSNILLTCAIVLKRINTVKYSLDWRSVCILVLVPTSLLSPLPTTSSDVKHHLISTISNSPPADNVRNL